MSYERLETRKGCHAKLCEKADPLKALGCVASYLRNDTFYLINDRPYAVWTGSFNFTRNAVMSFENAVVLYDTKIVDAFYEEYSQIAALSEPLDWTKPWIDPQWRIQTWT